MANDAGETVRFQLKIAEIPDNQLDTVIKMVLIQNCIAGIQGKTIFGLIPKPLVVDTPGIDAPNILTMDVYTSFAGLNEAAQNAHIQELKQHIQYQWSQLYENLNQKRRLKMSSPKRKLSKTIKVAFDNYRWKQLLRDIAALGQPGNIEELAETGFMRANGLGIQLTYLDTSPTVFELRVDLGPIPRQLDTGNVLKSLLIHNHFAGDESGIWWGLHPTGDRIIMAVEHPLSTSTQHFMAPSGHDMIALIQDTAKQSGKLWETILLGTQHVRSARQ